MHCRIGMCNNVSIESGGQIMTNNNHIAKNAEERSSIKLVDDISNLIEEAKSHVAREYNTAHLLLNWMIGTRINNEVLQLKRAEYGEQVVAEISNVLSSRYGSGYGRASLFRMIKFSKLFRKKEIISTLSRQLSWSHFILICGIEEEIKRDFYIQICRVQR